MADGLSHARKCKLSTVPAQVTGTNTNLCVYFSAANLPSEMFDADGSYPAQNGGGDIRFSSDAAGSNLLPVDIVSFVIDNDPGNGSANIWVRLPNVRDSQVDDVYVWWNTPGSDSQPSAVAANGRQAVWQDAHAVLLMESTTPTERTGNFSFTKNGTPTAISDGPFGAALAFAEDERFYNTSDSDLYSLPVSNDYTVEAICRRESGYLTNSPYLAFDGSDDEIHYLSDHVSIGHARVFHRDAGGSILISDSTVGTDWVWLSKTTRAYNDHELYIDGVLSASSTANASGVGPFSGFYIGGWFITSGQNHLGDIQAVFLWPAARPASATATSKSNQSAPGSFITVGTPEDAAGEEANSTGVLTPTAVYGGGAGDVSWVDTANLAADDDSFAYASFSGDQEDTDQLILSFGATDLVPAGSTIDGVEVRLGVSVASGADGFKIIGQLRDAGEAFGTTKTSAEFTNTTEAEIVFGGETDLWGSSLTAADVNQTLFSYEFKAFREAPHFNETVRVDYVEMVVYYTPGEEAGEIAITGFTNTATLGSLTLAAQSPGSINITQDGIDNPATMGSLTIAADTAGVITIAGFENTASFGSLVIASQTPGSITLTGFTNAASFGTLTIESVGDPTGEIAITGFESAATLGSLVIASQTPGSIGITGFSSPATLGSLTLTRQDDQEIGITGFSNPASFGTLSIQAVVANQITLTGLENAASFGDLALSSQSEGSIELTGITNTPSFGTLTLEGQTTAEIEITGFTVTPSFGNLTIVGPQGREIALTGISNPVVLGALRVHIDAEDAQFVVPYRADIPTSIQETNPELYDYLYEQAKNIREQHILGEAGQRFLPWQALNRWTLEQEYMLGSLSQFIHPTFGMLRARYVRFAQMVDTPTGVPVGFVKGVSQLDWRVTNDFSESNSLSSVGLVASAVLPASDSYGWVIIEGANLYKVGLKTDESASQGAELMWSGDGELNPQGAGIVLCSLVADVTRTSATGFDSGDLVINIGSSNGQALYNDSITQIEEIQIQVDAAIASVQTLQTASANGDEALAATIQTLTASVDESIAQINAQLITQSNRDSALAQTITTLEASLQDEILAAVGSERIARVNADAAVVQLIDIARAEFNTNLVDQQSSIATIESRVSLLATATNAQASTVEALSVAINDPSTGLAASAAAITSITASVSSLGDDVTALAGSVSTLSTTVGDNTTTLTEYGESIDGIEARWGVNINVNGTVVGAIRLDGDASESVFSVLVDKFVVTDDTDSAAPFEISGGVVRLKSAHISEVIQSSSWNSGTKEGWQIDQGGVIRGRGIEIYDDLGNLIFGSGSNILVNSFDIQVAKMSILGNKIRKTGTDGWDGNVRVKSSSQVGWVVSFTAPANSHALMVGVTDSMTTGTDWTALDYAFYLRSDGSLEARESGSGAINLGTYVAGDSFHIEYNGKYVRYYKNGSWLRSSTLTEASKVLHGAACFYTQGGEIEDFFFTATPFSIPDYSDVGGTKPPTNADNTASNAQSPSWLSSPVVWSGNKITTGNIGTYISSLSASYITAGSMSAAYITAGTIVAAKFQTDAGVDLAAIEPGQLNQKLDYTDTSPRTINSSWSAVTPSNPPNLAVDNHKAIISAYARLRYTTLAPGWGGFVANYNWQLMRRLNGGSWTTIHSGSGNINALDSSYQDVVLFEKFEDFSPPTGTIEYGIRYQTVPDAGTYNWSGNSDDTNLEVEGIFYK